MLFCSKKGSQHPDSAVRAEFVSHTPPQVFPHLFGLIDDLKHFLPGCLLPAPFQLLPPLQPVLLQLLLWQQLPFLDSFGCWAWFHTQNKTVTKQRGPTLTELLTNQAAKTRRFPRTWAVSLFWWRCLLTFISLFLVFKSRQFPLPLLRPTASGEGRLVLLVSPIFSSVLLLCVFEGFERLFTTWFSSKFAPYRFWRERESSARKPTVSSERRRDLSLTLSSLGKLFYTFRRKGLFDFGFHFYVCGQTILKQKKHENNYEKKT